MDSEQLLKSILDRTNGRSITWSLQQYGSYIATGYSIGEGLEIKLYFDVIDDQFDESAKKLNLYMTYLDSSAGKTIRKNIYSYIYSINFARTDMGNLYEKIIESSSTNNLLLEVINQISK